MVAGTISHYRIPEKLGGAAAHLSLGEGLTIPGAPRADPVARDDVRKALPVVDEQKSSVLKLRFFRWIEGGKKPPRP